MYHAVDHLKDEIGGILLFKLIVVRSNLAKVSTRCSSHAYSYCEND